MRRFMLDRGTDVTGVSGTGVVCEGVEFEDGKVALRWIVGEHRSTVVYDDIDAVLAIHGHDGATRLVWLDQPITLKHRLTDSGLARFLWWTAHQMKFPYRDAGFCVARLFCSERGIDPDVAESDVVTGTWQPGSAE